MARALSSAVAPDRLTLVVNVGDDDYMYGAHVAADLDTVTYTMAGIEGPHGWGIAGDTFYVMDEMSRRGADTTFRLGDRDLATCLERTAALRSGTRLSEITRMITRSLGIETSIIPATDNDVGTIVQLSDRTWLPFQEYFAIRHHEDEVAAVDYPGAATAAAAPGVIEALENADLIVIAPSNPPLSIWPILAVPGIRDVVAAVEQVVAVSPLFAGKALKGPADRVLRSLGLPEGTAGILECYAGLISTLVVDLSDADDEALTTSEVRVVSADTRMTTAEQGTAFGTWLIDTMTR
jgi:LPPG:FO 2-phospho-L-lactate transferase